MKDFSSGINSKLLFLGEVSNREIYAEGRNRDTGKLSYLSRDLTVVVALNNYFLKIPLKMKGSVLTVFYEAIMRERIPPTPENFLF